MYNTMGDIMLDFAVFIFSEHLKSIAVLSPKNDVATDKKGFFFLFATCVMMLCVTLLVNI